MDLPEKLNPASAPVDENLQKLSHEDFQKLLRGWFENSGLITETRSYLRMQLIRMLNTTKLGKQSSRPREPVSPRVQILNMLVAEHLMRYKYLYTLSMFSNEMSALSVPPEFNFLFVSDPGTSKIRFDKNQVLRILNFLNAATTREDVDVIFSEYYDCHDENNGNGNSLLLCLLHGNVPSAVNQMHDVEDVGVMTVVKHLRHLLGEIRAPNHVIIGIERTIHQFVHNLEQKNNVDMHKNCGISGEKPLETDKKNVATQKSNNRQSSAEREMKIISIHNENAKMIRRIYKYRMSQMENLQKQLKAKMKDIDVVKESPPAKLEKCTLKHCNENCEEARENLEVLKAQNSELKMLINERDKQVKTLEMKLVKLATALVQAQSKVIASHRRSTSAEEEDTFTETDQVTTEKQTNSKKTNKTKIEPLKTFFYDVERKLDDLETENDILDSEYKLFKNTIYP